MKRELSGSSIKKEVEEEHEEAKRRILDEDSHP